MSETENVGSKGIPMPSTAISLSKSKLGRVILIGEYLFPDGDAAAIRTMSLARILRDAGYAVTVLGKGKPRVEDFAPELDCYIVEGIRYVTMNPAAVTMRQRILNPVGRMRIFISTLEALDLSDCKAIIINACGSARHLPFVQAFCRRRRIPLIGDVCEWYDPRQMNGGVLNPLYWVFSAVFHFSIPRLRNIIAVSSLLARRFEGRGRSVIRVAAPMDVECMPSVDATPSDRIVLLYAGMAGRKDLLVEVLMALSILTPQERCRIEFRLLGPSRSEVLQLLGESAPLLSQLDGVVKILGRVPRSNVIGALQEVHFSVLLRPNLRYANAGFPSKIAESLAVGTPVLLNITSDLGEYLADESAALIVNGTSSAEVAKTLRRALRLTPNELRGLRSGARAKALQHFDYRLYVKSLADFVAAAR